MAATRLAVSRVQLVLAASAPVAGFLVATRINAAGKKIHPSELDIYDKQVEVKEIFLEDPASALELQVSTGRRAVWEYWDKSKGVVKKTKSTLATVRSKSIEFAELITTDQVFQIKVGCISAGVLGGALLAGRGRRPFRRVLYSAGLGTVAASLCYPNKAADISLNGYKKAKVFISEQWEKYNEKKATVPETTIEENILEPVSEDKDITESFVVIEAPSALPESELLTEEVIEPPANQIIEVELIKEDAKPEAVPASKENVESMMTLIPFVGWFFKSKSSVVDESVSEAGESQAENKISEVEDIASNLESKEEGKDSEERNEEEGVAEKDETQDEAPAVVVEGDHGQSNPEDKDMYSTRT